MARVDSINIIKGTDRQFTLIVTQKPSEEPKDLSAFVGGSGDVLALRFPSEDNDYEELTLTVNANGSKLQVESASAGLAGKIKVTLSDVDTALLRKGNGQNMELCIKEGAGPDYDIAKVQFVGQLNIAEKIFF